MDSDTCYNDHIINQENFMFDMDQSIEDVYFDLLIDQLHEYAEAYIENLQIGTK